MQIEPPASSTNASTSYTKDVAYASRFGVLQAPVHLSLAAGLRGWSSANPKDPLTYFDVACGDGETLLVLAAAYPQGQFFGFDFNPDHIAAAKEKVRRVGLTNVELVETDILDLQSLDLPNFDYACVVGAYSWIDSARREALRRFLKARGAPRCVVLIDYAAQPGAAAANTLYELIRMEAARHPGNSAEKLAGAARRMKALAAGGASFFRAYPSALSRLRDMMSKPADDEAHEVFNLRDGLWFADVAQDMSATGFQWANTAKTLHTYSEFVLPADLLPERGIAALDEQAHLDIALNTTHRADIFVPSDEQQVTLASALGDRPVVDFRRNGMDRLKAVSRKVQDLSNPMADRMVAAASTGITVSDLVAIGGSAQEAEAMLGRLLASSVLQLFVTMPVEYDGPAEGDGSARALSVPSAYNHDVVVQHFNVLDAKPFASPVAGSSLFIPPADRLSIYALSGGDLRKVYTEIKQAGLSTDSAFGNDEAAFIKSVETLAEQFAVTGAIDLVRLGIVSGT